ncbi:MAG: hypothetical protein DRJ03_14980 [Chloroflexi bacterium]|nr:MAG: hypothetical protein B6I35_10440 [Anaerolineaceae bacterium 4572_32.2]RLC76651.1 MAG: hypothetical protein DRI81_09870 [Chloroflexota bacterium]RLC84181.1 MAG: hypothetical protein DRJ03_14980 [Chloroflexota bacterium]HEY71958.1 hypothetical protein [Thermoflexia bacterium]
MVKKINLKQIERNIFRDYLQDGLVDIMFGAYFLLLGLGLAAGTAVFIVFSIVFFAPLLQGLKKRFTYPRTGYVELRQGDPGPVPWFVLGSFVLGLIALVAVLIAAGVIARPAQWYRWMPIFFGIWLTGIFLGLALSVGLMRYHVVAGVALAGGPTFALLPLTGKLENIGLLFAAVGAMLLTWGVFAFVRFLRKYPLPTKRDDDVTD